VRNFLAKRGRVKKCIREHDHKSGGAVDVGKKGKLKEGKEETPNTPLDKKVGSWEIRGEKRVENVAWSGKPELVWGGRELNQNHESTGPSPSENKISGGNKGACAWNEKGDSTALESLEQKNGKKSDQKGPGLFAGDGGLNQWQTVEGKRHRKDVTPVKKVQKKSGKITAGEGVDVEKKTKTT